MLTARWAMHTVFRASSPVPYSLLAKQLPDSLHNTVLLRIVGVVLGRNLEQAGESLVVLVDSGSYALGDLGVVSAELVNAKCHTSRCLASRSEHIRVG
jgi:hypothetical protein